MPALSFSAWLAPGDVAGLESFEVNAGLLTRVYPQWYLSGSDGLPLRRPEAEGGHRERVAAVAQGREVELWPHLGAWALSGEVSDQGLARLLADAPLRRDHAAALLRLAQEDGARGLSLDYPPGSGVDRAAYSAFVLDISSAVHAAGLALGIVVHPDPEQQEGSGPGGTEDYAALAAVCDRLQMLAFRRGGRPGSLPGPLAPPEWCAKTLAKALAHAPHAKIEWAMPGFGYDWGGEPLPIETRFSRWEGLVKAHPPERRDPVTAELTLRYGGREVWMNDAISLTAKLWQIRRCGVAEASLWNLGSEDPRLWALLDTLPKDFLGSSAA